MNNYDKGGYSDAVRKTTILDVEGYLAAIFCLLMMLDQKVSFLISLAAAVSGLVILKLIFKTKAGYFLVSAVFSLFWAYAVSSGWFRDGNWVAGGLLFAVIFAISAYLHKEKYDND